MAHRGAACSCAAPLRSPYKAARYQLCRPCRSLRPACPRLLQRQESVRARNARGARADAAAARAGGAQDENAAELLLAICKQ